MSPGSVLQETMLFDPMMEYAPLPHEEKFWPVGFPIVIRSNARDVLEAARESWGAYTAEFDRQPVELRFLVHDGPAGAVPEPVFRSQHGLLMIVSDRDHFAVCDLHQRFAWAYLSRESVAAHGWFRWFYLDAMGYFLLTQFDVTPVHAAVVERGGRGVLLCGESGAGKSTLAYACARAGWEYGGDDSALLVEGPGLELRGKPHHFRFRPEAVALFPELQAWTPQLKPNGKPTLEVPVAAFADVRTVTHSQADLLVFLKRGAWPVKACALPEEEIEERLQRDMPAYPQPVLERHRKAVGKLARVPAYELHYERLADALGMLAGLVERT